MLGPVDHVGYLARDLEVAVRELVALLGVPVVRHFARPQFSLVGAYLGPGTGTIEVFTFTDPELLTARLGDARIQLDHVAFEVDDIDTTAAVLRRSGARFAGPDRRTETLEPIDLSGVLNLWSLPETTNGQAIQLLQR